MVGLAFLCDDLREQGISVSLSVGEDGAAGFLQRAGFFDLLPSEVVLSADLPPARLEYLRVFRGANPALLEFTRIDDTAGIRVVLATFRRILHYRLKYSVNDAKTLAMMLSELCHNILDHNPEATGGVVAMQVFNAPAGRFMQLVVADRGIGIRQTLTRHEAHAGLATDVKAIERSVELGISEFDDRTHGNGLYHLMRLARLHQGTVHVRSGTGKVYFRSDRAAVMRFRVPPVQGTQFSIVFPLGIAERVDSFEKER